MNAIATIKTEFSPAIAVWVLPGQTWPGTIDRNGDCVVWLPDSFGRLHRVVFSKWEDRVTVKR